MQRKNSGRKPATDKRTARGASATKSGPGRFHKAGQTKATPPKISGANADFVLHKASPERKERRELVKAHGRRQALKAIKFWRGEAYNAASIVS